MAPGEVEMITRGTHEMGAFLMPTRSEPLMVGFFRGRVWIEVTPGEGPVAWHPEGGVQTVRAGDATQLHNEFKSNLAM